MSSINQAELWIRQQRLRRAERALQYPDLVGPSERPPLEADLREAIEGIRALRDQAAAEAGTTVPLSDHVRTPEGTWTPLEDAAAAVAGVPCAGFIREERTETYWSGRIIRLFDLAVTAIADDGHIDRVRGSLKVVVVVDPIADGEHRARVMTRGTGEELDGLGMRGMVFIPAPRASTARVSRA